MLLRPTVSNIKKCANLLLAGEVVAFPTETVYGLGANTFDPVAVEKIFKIKRRPFFDPLIVHICNRRMIKLLIPENFLNFYLAERLMEEFWPGPLTLIVPKSEHVPDIVTSGLKTIAIRMPSNRIALSLIKKAAVPVAAPSANRFGLLSPVEAEHVEEQLGKNIYVLDGGRTSVGVESTILDISERDIFILRPGKILKSDIEKVIKKRIFFKKKIDFKPKAPGQIKNHYSPLTPLFLVPSDFIYKILPFINDMKVSIILWKKDPSVKGKYVRWFSKNGDTLTACRNLFYILHSADSDKTKAIFVERPPVVKNDGFIYAFMDRLIKASDGDEKSSFVRTILKQYIKSV